MRVLGLDLGVTSIGWALVEENDKNPLENKIIKLGVRVNPLSVDEKTNFEKGKPITTNAGRTLARSARRNLQRYKLRRKNLCEVLKNHNIISEDDILTENGKNTTFQTQELRAKSAVEKISLTEFARVLFLINKKRGYKSSRKVNADDEGQIIDGMGIAKILFEKNLTPGQYAYQLLQDGKKQIPDFYRSDLQTEFDKVWNFQKQFYPEILTENLKNELKNKGVNATWAILKQPFNLAGIKQIGNALEKKLEKYEWRGKAVTEQLDPEKLAVVLQEINGNINNSSKYLGAISDRSKELFFKNQTVGQYLYEQLCENRHAKLKNQVFYRQDYFDEFEKIWDTQAKYHPELTPKLKEEIRDIVIFYQRKLKSQKGMISICEFERREIVKDGKKKIVGPKVAPKSSPLFQEFKIWQRLHDIKFQNAETKEVFPLDLEFKNDIFEELNVKGNLKGREVLTLIGYGKEWKANFEKLDGNLTNKAFYEAYLKILTEEKIDFSKEFKLKKDADEVKLDDVNVGAKVIKNFVKNEFEKLGIDTGILDFNSDLEGKDFEKQPSYQLWHFLYSYEGDDSASGNELLHRLLQEKFGFKESHAKILAQITFPQDYGSLSTKAMRKILTHMKAGLPYAKKNDEDSALSATAMAGYNHSKSLTKEEIANRVPKKKLEILSKNSLRNPVAEKILNQMINLVNEVIEEYGEIGEIRIELSRELKKNAQERADMTAEISKTTAEHLKIIEVIRNDFYIPMPSRNDIIRYKLYQELQKNGYKDLYTDTKIEYENLFSKKYDIDHIIPQSRVFDDSFSNKVLVPRQSNLDKGNMTAFDYYDNLSVERKEKFINIIAELYKLDEISKSKFEKLQKKSSEIGEGFIERDLRNSQYIARKAREILYEVSRNVVSTSGKITARLREDWNLVDMMKELNLEKFRALGLTKMVENSKGQSKEIIDEWTKRNDHRHHAMDALTVAFTTHNHIQYLNYLNARLNENDKKHAIILNIQNKITTQIEKENGRKSRKFTVPMENFRREAKSHLEEILISHKAKNKVVTKNKNKTKAKDKFRIKTELTPRGQLHKETIYGTAKILVKKEEKISAKFDFETIQKVENKIFRNVLQKRLEENGNDPKKAFSGKNAVNKNAIYVDLENNIKVPETVTLAWYETQYTIRKQVNPDNFKDYKNLDKIVDLGVKNILKNRLDEFNGNAKEAFSDLDNNPIWLNKDKGISIKTVTITGVSNAESLHSKKDHLGKEILDENGNEIPVDFVSTGNNHHVAIYEDAEGNLQENVVSFYVAVERVQQKLPIIDRDFNADLGWKFLFTMKQNEMFLFPSEDFNPSECDLFDEKNLKIISKNLFRVQKLATKNYFFRHHLETNVEIPKALNGVTYKSQLGLNGIVGIVKVRLNHLGKIVQIGEY